MSFGILTLNLWSINEPLEARYCALETGLKRLRPDIICLQEVLRDPRWGRSQCELVARMCNTARSVEENGLAVICSSAVVRSTSVALPEFTGDGPRHVLLVQFEIEKRPVMVANTHLAYPSEMSWERRKQAEVLLTAIKQNRSKGMAAILCGDLNDIPDSPTIRAILDSDQQFYDVFAACGPNNPGVTYSRRNHYVDPSWSLDERIDYIFASRDLAAHACSVVFDGTNGLDLVSDHFGVFCNVTFR
jgi:endonuclease/exonuclease/phosphatase family metal-dependent hydrolase